MKLFIVALLIVSVNTLLADDRQDGAPFYPKNYALKPGGPDDKPIEEGLQQPVGRKEKALVPPSPGFESIGREDATPPEAPIKKLPRDPIPAQSMSLIVSAADHDHLHRNIERFLKLGERTHIRINTVFLIGNGAAERKELTAIWSRVIKQQGSVKGVLGIPEPYKVTQSPTWIFKTQQGEIVLEGVEDPGKYVTQQGAVVMEKLPQ